MTNKFKYTVHRVEWIVALVITDEYGNGRETYESYIFPTREEAESYLPEVAVPHKYVKERWVPKNAPHEYCEAFVTCRNVFDHDYLE